MESSGAASRRCFSLSVIPSLRSNESSSSIGGIKVSRDARISAAAFCDSMMTCVTSIVLRDIDGDTGAPPKSVAYEITIRSDGPAFHLQPLQMLRQIETWVVRGVGCVQTWFTMSTPRKGHPIGISVNELGIARCLVPR